jgi:membrane-associated phospholipid phosphatase
MGAEVAGLTWVTTTLVKDLVGRRRPYAYNESLDAEERVALAGGDPRHVVRSFPSGHASMSFAAAVFAATVVSDTAPGNRALGTTVWTVSLGLAGLAGWSRVQGGVHFPSDVVAGALLGGAIGYAVPRAHRRAATGGPAGGLTLGVAPTPGGGIGVAARIALR